MLSGLKPQEISNLAWEDINLDGEEIGFLLGERLVPLSKRVLQNTFREICLFSKQYEQTELAFAFGVNQVGFWIKRIGEETKIVLTATHFRWRFVFDLIGEGKSPKEIAELIGTTELYVRRFINRIDP